MKSVLLESTSLLNKRSQMEDKKGWEGPQSRQTLKIMSDKQKIKERKNAVNNTRDNPRTKKQIEVITGP